MRGDALSLLNSASASFDADFELGASPDVRLVVPRTYGSDLFFFYLFQHFEDLLLFWAELNF